MSSELESQGVPAAYAARWLDLLEQRGVSADRALEGTGLTPEMVEDPSGRLALGAVAMLLANGTQLANDPSLGLELGLELKPTSHGSLGVALISCDSLGDAIRLGERYMIQRSLPWGIRLVVEGAVAVMQFVENVSLGPLRTLVLEIVLGGVVRLGELMLGISFANPEIEFWADYPEQPHHARFHPRLPRVRYEQPELCARFPVAWLSRPLSWREPVAKRAAVAALEDERRLLNTESADYVERTRVLLADPKNRYPDLDETSQRLHVSSRTLRRHLQKQNVTFQALRDEARRTRAMHLLSQSVLPVEEIASELGYADAAGFIRAFVRWTGRTPTAHRKKARGGEGQ